MAYVEPTAVAHYGHPRPRADEGRVREWLRQKYRPVLLEMRSDLEKNPTALRGDPRDLGDSISALERALERGLAD